MAGGNFILGGLLSGLGRGMEQDYLAKREEALQRLRKQNQMDAENRAEQRDIRKESRTDERDARKMERDAGYDIQKLKVAGDIKSADRRDQFGYDVQLTKIKANEERGTVAFKDKLDRDMATLRARLDQNNDAESQRLKAELDSGNIKDRVTDANGRVILIRNDGKMVTTPFTEKDKVDTSTYKSKEQQEEERRWKGKTPGNFDPNASPTPSNSGDGSPWYSPGAKPATTERVATKAQVQEAAKAKGWTVEQTQRWMRENGWSLR